MRKLPRRLNNNKRNFQQRHKAETTNVSSKPRSHETEKGNDEEVAKGDIRIERLKSTD